jgi:alkylated DNA repair dioxygenase AlkB
MLVSSAPVASSLFEPDVPSGFHYRDDFISANEERALLDDINRIEFDTFEMRGVVAKRRVAFYGMSYDERSYPERPMPEFLVRVRAGLADWARVEPGDFVMALINEYRPGAPIGWHRDAPQYDITAGVSVLSSCRMRLRPYVPPPKQRSPQPARRTTTHEITLAPRSAYLITGVARQDYEHSIPAVDELRYSITFRTLRRK